MRSSYLAAVVISLAACGGGKTSATAPTDAGVADDASESGTTTLEAGAFTPGTAITAPANQWTWIPFSNAVCGNGVSTGIGVNLNPNATRVLIYFEGGGACWNDVSCYTLGTAGNFASGYTETDFQSESTDTAYLAMPGGFFDRAASDNPFQDYSYVYLPYCTGDVFAGNAVVPLGTNTAHFVGYENVAAFLERIVPTFPSVERVIVAGTSAGGYGAAINWYQIQNAFGSIRVDVIDDSGTFMPADVTAEGDGNIPLAISTWNVASIVPAGCTGCAADPSKLYGFYGKLYPTHRGSLLSYTEDTVLPQFYGITTPEFEQGLYEDIAQEFAPNPNLQAFVVGGSGHGLFFSPDLASGGVTLQQWITEQVSDSASWSTAEPSDAGVAGTDGG